MKRLHGKLVMAAIILSCGLVMQAEQSERDSVQRDRESRREAAFYTPDSARGAGQEHGSR